MDFKLNRFFNIYIILYIVFCDGYIVRDCNARLCNVTKCK